MRGGLKVLSGEDVVDTLAAFGFIAIGGTKHFKVRRTSPGGEETIPNHDVVAKGTCARSSRRHPGMSRKRI
jgi:hypothetical protein